MLTCVTGGTGFVGSYVVRALRDDGHTVRVLHRTSSKLSALAGLEYESCSGDVTDIDTLRAAFAGCDWVFHVAAVADYWNADNARMFEVNVGGTRKVLQAAREAGVKRVVFTSSAATIGLPHDDTLADESSPFNLPPAAFPYGTSKVLAEEVVSEAVAQYGQDVVIVNPAIVIGPGDLNQISGSFVVQMARWQWLTPVSGGGLSVTDVRDVAAAHIAAALRGRSGERYILNSANYPDHEWFGMIADVLDIAPPLITIPNAAVPLLAGLIDALRRIGIPTPVDANQIRLATRTIYFDSSKARAELHEPQIDMRQSVQDTVDWYRDNGFIQESIMANVLSWIGRRLHRV